MSRPAKIAFLMMIALAALTVGCPQKPPVLETDRIPVPAAPPPPPRVAVKFADAALEAVVRAQLGKTGGDLFEDDVKSITALDAHKKSITDLAGLEHLTGLKALDLGANYLRMIDPLAKLSGLEELKLDENFIVDVSPLAGLKKLTHLDLSSNEIMDVSPLAGLTNLVVLDLGDNEIRDLGPLSELKDQGVSIQLRDPRR